MIQFFVILFSLTIIPIAEARHKHISMSIFAAPETSLYTQLFERVYKDAFRRLGYTFEFKVVPAARASIEADNGMTDGEPGRLYEHNLQFSNLIRIEEAIDEAALAAFTAQRGIKVNSWDAIKQRGYRVDVLRGMTFIKGAGIDPRLIFQLNDRSQAFPRLMSGRADVYVDAELDFSALMRSSRYTKMRIYRAGVVEKRLIYGFLHRKHEELVPRVAEVLRQFKKEGLIARYKRELIEKSVP